MEKEAERGERKKKLEREKPGKEKGRRREKLGKGETKDT